MSKGEMYMTVKQISVFLENRSGQLADLTKTLSENGVDLRTLTIAETTEFGIVRMIVNDPDKASSVLKEAGYVCALTQVLAVVVPDVPGGLYSVLKILCDNDINLEYTYAFTSKKKDGAYTIFHVGEKNVGAAIEALTQKGIEIVPQSELDAL